VPPAEILTPWADPPPAAASKGLRRGRQLHGVVMLGLLAGPVVCGGVAQADPAALLAHVRLISDAGSLLSGIAVGPRQRTGHCCSRPEGALPDKVMEIELQGGLDRRFSAVPAAARSAHVPSLDYTKFCVDL
jgi:hypothetical protein